MAACRLASSVSGSAISALLGMSAARLPGRTPWHQLADTDVPSRSHAVFGRASGRRLEGGGGAAGALGPDHRRDPGAREDATGHAQDVVEADGVDLLLVRAVGEVAEAVELVQHHGRA